MKTRTRPARTATRRGLSRHRRLAAGLAIVLAAVPVGAAGFALPTAVSAVPAGAAFGDFTEVTPPDPLFVTPQDEDFWVVSTASADSDGDGDLDIVILGYYVVYNTSVEERLVLIRNDGPASPTEWEFAYLEVPLGDLTTGASDLAWGDVDGDGDQDLAVATDGRTVVYRNDAGVLTVTDTVLPGYWEENDQAEFDLPSVTWADYDNDGDLDLRLYRNGAPAAPPRALPEPGSLSSTGQWNLAGLPHGLYTWALRAVDSAYNAGPAAQGTFVVGDADPTAVFADGFESGTTSAWGP